MSSELTVQAWENRFESTVWSRKTGWTDRVTKLQLSTDKQLAEWQPEFTVVYLRGGRRTLGHLSCDAYQLGDVVQFALAHGIPVT